MSCGWPFHNKPGCEECQKWETMYGQNLTDWLDQRAEIRAAAKAARHKTTQAGGSAPVQPGGE